MRLNKLTTSTLLLAGMASVAQAQELHFNEIYASMTGTDSFEYIELIGTPNMSLDEIVVITIDGDNLAGGTIDRVWDLTGLTVPADGYFVIGNIASVANVDYDAANGPHTTGGAANNIENGTQTFYLLRVPSALDRADLAGPLFHADTDPDGDLMTSIGMSPANFQILENIGMMDGGGATEYVYDCAGVLGPDGTFFPAGIFRPGDYPNDWCGDTWLDFNNPGGPDQTPGAANPTATCSITVGTTMGCGGTGTGMGTPYCDPMNDNSTGFPTILAGSMSGAAGSGLHLEATQGPSGQFGYFLIGTAADDPGTPVSNGRLCLSITGGNQFGRYNVAGNLNSVGQFDAGGVLQNLPGTSSTGTGYDVPTTVPISGSPMIMAGETWHFQLWHRENGGSSNFSNGLSVTF